MIDTKIRFFWKTNVLRKNVHTWTVWGCGFSPSFLPAVLYPPNEVYLKLRKKRFSSRFFWLRRYRYSSVTKKSDRNIRKSTSSWYRTYSIPWGSTTTGTQARIYCNTNSASLKFSSFLCIHFQLCNCYLSQSACDKRKFGVYKLVFWEI